MKLWSVIKKKLTEEYITSTMEDKDYKCSFRKIHELAEKAADDLLRMNNYKCIVLCRQEFWAAISVLAIIAAEKICVPLSANYGMSTCEKIIRTIKPDVIITDDPFFVQGLGAFIYDITNGSFKGSVICAEYEEQLNDVRFVMFTSGSTGNPKGVMLSEDNVYTNALDIIKYFPVMEKDRILIARPLYHSAVLTGEFLVSILRGVNIIFAVTKYDPFSLLRNIKEFKITILCYTPTMLFHLARIANKEQIKLRLIVMSGEGVLPIQAKLIRKAFPTSDIYSVYGLTEASPRVCYLKPDLFDEKNEYVGIALPSVDLRIIDDVKNECFPEQIGHLYVKGPNVMKGYYNNPLLTQEVVKEGWLSTGDEALINTDGLVRIVGRRDDLIVKGGMNIYPLEIENRVREIKDVKDVIAYKHKTAVGNGIGIDIVLTDDSLLDIVELKKELYSVLETYMYPNQVRIVDSVQINATGKLLRHRDGGSGCNAYKIE